MTAISLAGTGLLDRLGVSHVTRGVPPARTRQSATAPLATRVTFGNGNDSSAVYSDPRSTSGAVRLWSSSVGKDDTVSALMARNQDRRTNNLGKRWEGLGGALLTRFGDTGEDDSQTVVDDTVPVVPDGVTPAEQAQGAAAILAHQTAELAGVTTNAQTAGLTIRTRSGQSVELKISEGIDGTMGMKVDLHASGPVSASERAAVAQLAKGLDRALAGLGRDDAVQLDLSGLMGYDRSAIASVDLTAQNTLPYQVLGSFSLHLGDDAQSIALKGSDGDMKLVVDTGTPLGNTSTLQRGAAVQRTLDRMDRAGERGQLNAALIRQMKAAFTQFQAAAEGVHSLPTTPTSTTAARARVDAEVASQLSGLSDFDASFGGETHRSDRFGLPTEVGHADDRLSQTTTVQNSADHGQSVAQTVSEQLSADFLTAGSAGMLDVNSGNYMQTHIRDSSTVTTLVDSTADRITRVLRETDEQQLKTVAEVKNHRTVSTQTWPSQRIGAEQLH